MPSPGWLCSPIAGGNLPLLSPRGESTDAFCIISLPLVSSLLPTFPTCFLLQPCLKGTFSMQRNLRAVFTCHFPSEGFISLQPQRPQQQPKLNMGLKSYPGCPQPRQPCRGTEGCVCVNVHVCCVRTKTDVCPPE